MKYAIYHSADLDGITCGALAKIAHPDINLIGYDYGQPLDEIEAIPDGSEVYMMDVSLKKEEMYKLGRRVNFTWIDHHKSAIHEITERNLDKQLGNVVYTQKYNGVDHNSFWCYCEVGRAACELALEFFKLDDNLHNPTIINVIGKYDTFRKNEEWNEFILPFQLGLRSYIGLDVEKMVKFLNYELIGYGDVLQAGKQIISYQRQQTSIIMQNAFECFITIQTPNPYSTKDSEEEFECIAVNTMGLNTDLLPPEIDITGKILLQFILRKDDLWHISMRSEGDLDVGAICTKLGGGGHKNAAGCILTLNEKMERFWEFGGNNKDIPGFLVIDQIIEN